MDSSELHILALQRVKQVEPENASKILGCILLEDPDKQDMLQLAYGNDAEVHAKISHAKAMLDAIVACCSSPPAFGYHYWPQPQNHHHYSGGGCYYASENALIYNGGAGGPPRSRLSSTRRPCHYFIKGICKNGQSCHYSHHRQEAQVCSGDHQHSGALEKLELEIIELLKSRHGQPLSIASLPTLYGDRYGKSLKADGYLTESKRHGKAGYSLSRLISRLSKITTIERPHGQHYVVLAEDAGRYKELMSRGGGERGGDMGSSSHQVYLTFPSESTFAEQDVANYFGLYGSVRDVRIPWQEKRMFGFVSFHNPETVNTILTMRIPHFIGESRVLVKRYIEKSKCIERYRPRSLRHFVGMDMDDDDDEYDDQPPARMVMRNQQRLLATEKRLIELERKRFFAMPPQQYQHVYFDCSIGDDDGQGQGQGQPPPRHPPLIITQQARASSSSSYDDDDDDDDIQLPESPFTSSAVPMLM